MTQALRLVLFVLLAAVAFLPTAGGNASPPTDLMKGVYYRACISGRGENLVSQDTLVATCRCQQTNFEKDITRENVQALHSGADTPDSRMARYRVLLNAEAPCLYISVEDIVQHACATDPKLAGAPQDSVADLCACTAALTAEWAKLSARPVMAELLKRDTTLKESLLPFVRSDEFTKQVAKNMSSCATNASPDAP